MCYSDVMAACGIHSCVNYAKDDVWAGRTLQKVKSKQTDIHHVCKKRATIFLPLTVPNADQFSKLFHRQP